MIRVGGESGIGAASLALSNGEKWHYISFILSIHSVKTRQEVQHIPSIQFFVNKTKNSEL